MTTVGEIAAYLDAAPADVWFSSGSSVDLAIKRGAPASEGGEGTMTFCAAYARGANELAANTRSDLVILDRVLASGGGPQEACPHAKAVILSDAARLDFMRSLDWFFRPARPSGIHPSAVIDATAVIAPDVYIGPQSSIGPRVMIGSETVVHAGVHIYHDVRIGARTVIHAGSVIGADGFGYERAPGGAFVKFPHTGGVDIGDDVEIGANVCIDRAALGTTRVERGAKIDNLVHIAHNVVIGEDAAVVAHAMIGGSTSIGPRAWIAPSACVREGLSIGERAVVGLASLVTKDVPSAHTVLGSPARDILEHRRLQRFLNEAVAKRDASRET